MKPDNRQELAEIIARLEQFKKDVHDYDYDADDLWLINEALGRLKQI